MIEKVKKQSIWNKPIGGTRSDEKKVPSVPAIVIWLILFWPVGIVLLIRRLWK